MKKKQGFIWLTVATVVGSIINFLYSILTKRFVPPEELGIFSTCTIVESYLCYLQLGSINAYNRDLPQLLGAGKKEEAQSLKNTVFTFLLIVYGSTLVLGELFFYFGNGTFLGTLTMPYMIGYMLSVLVSFLSIFENFSMSTARINGLFNYSAVVGFVTAFLSSVTGVFLVYWFQGTEFAYYSLYARFILMYLIPVVLYCRSFKGIKLQIDKKLLKPVLWTGIPLLINSFIWKIVTSIDKFVILGFMDATALGHYSIANLGFSTLLLIPQTISNVYYIKMNELYGATQSTDALIAYAKKSTFINSVVTCITSLVAFYFLPIFIQFVMPMYSEGTDAALVIIVGVAIYASTFSFGHLFTILKKNTQLIVNTSLLCVFNAVFSVALVLVGGADIVNVAIGTSMSYAAYSVLLIIRLGRMFRVGILDMLKNSWLVVACAVVPCCGFYFLGNYLSWSLFLSFFAAFATSVVLLFVFFEKRIVNILTKKESLF